MKKNYGATPIILALLKSPAFLIAVISFILLLPILVGSFAMVFKIISLINQPIGNGSIPIWMLFVGGIAFIFVYRRIVQMRYQSEVLRNPPGGGY
jgi:hypothetical protein